MTIPAESNSAGMKVEKSEKEVYEATCDNRRDRSTGKQICNVFRNASHSPKSEFINTSTASSNGRSGIPSNMDTKESKRKCVLLSLDDDQLIISNVSNNNNIGSKNMDFSNTVGSWGSWEDNTVGRHLTKSSTICEDDLPYGEWQEGGDVENDLWRRAADPTIMKPGNCNGEGFFTCHQLSSERLHHEKTVNQPLACLELQALSSHVQTLPPISLLSCKNTDGTADSSPNDEHIFSDLKVNAEHFYRTRLHSFHDAERNSALSKKSGENRSLEDSFTHHINGDEDTGRMASDSDFCDPRLILKSTRNTSTSDAKSNPSSPKRRFEG